MRVVAMVLFVITLQTDNNRCNRHCTQAKVSHKQGMIGASSYLDTYNVVFCNN